MSALDVFATIADRPWCLLPLAGWLLCYALFARVLR